MLTENVSPPVVIIKLSSVTTELMQYQVPTTSHGFGSLAIFVMEGKTLEMIPYEELLQALADSVQLEGSQSNRFGTVAHKKSLDTATSTKHPPTLVSVFLHIISASDAPE